LDAAGLAPSSSQTLTEVTGSLAGVCLAVYVLTRFSVHVSYNLDPRLRVVNILSALNMDKRSTSPLLRRGA